MKRTVAVFAGIFTLLFILASINGKQRLERTSNKFFLAPGDTILAAGDSLTYGFGSGPGESYPAVLQRISGLHVVNAGKNGETSQEGLRRLPALLSKHRPKLTILCYGGNDLLQHRSKQALKHNLVAMIRLIRASGSNVLLLSLPDITRFALEPLKLYDEVSKETGVPLLRGGLAEILKLPSLKNDQIHPNAEGYRILATRIYKKLREKNWLP